MPTTTTKTKTTTTTTTTTKKMLTALLDGIDGVVLGDVVVAHGHERRLGRHLIWDVLALAVLPDHMVSHLDCRAEVPYGCLDLC